MVERDVIDALPTTRNMQSVGSIVPGVKLSRPDVGGSQGMEQTYMRTHGADDRHTSMQVDGMTVNSSMGDGNIQAYNDDALAQQVVFQTSGMPAEVAAGGVRVNLIPKDGGNTVKGGGFFGGTASSWQANNLTDDLRAQRLQVPQLRRPRAGLQLQHGRPDHEGQAVVLQHGPARLRRRRASATRSIQPTTSTSRASSTRPAIRPSSISTCAMRCFASPIRPTRRRKSARTSSGSGTQGSGAPVRIQPDHRIRHPRSSSRALLCGAGQADLDADQQAAAGGRLLHEHRTPQRSAIRRRSRTSPRSPSPPAWYQKVTHSASNGNVWGAAPGGSIGIYPDRKVLSGALSYVTGSHSIKVGSQWSFGVDGNSQIRTGDLVQNYVDAPARRCAEGDPWTAVRRFSVTVYNTPTRYFEYVNYDLGIYAQDTWTLKRLTISPGVRYDKFNAKSQGGCRSRRPVHARVLPRRSAGPAELERHCAQALGCLRPVRQRQTAIKGSVSKYMLPWAGGWAKRYDPFTAVGDSRTWNDLNGDDIAEDNEIGPSGNANFGVSTGRAPAQDLEARVQPRRNTRGPASAAPARLGVRAATSIATSTTRRRSRIRC